MLRPIIIAQDNIMLIFNISNMGLISLIAGGIHDANKAIKQNNAKKDDTVQTIVVKNKFSIDVPSFLSPTDRFGEDVTIQYWNKTLDVALQVIDEPKQEFIESLNELRKEIPDFGKDNSMLDNMAVMVLTNIFEDIDKIEINDRYETKINGLNALTLNAFQKRTFFKDAVFGSFAFIEGKNTLYQIIIISGGTSITKLAEKLDKSIKSFKELQ